MLKIVGLGILYSWLFCWVLIAGLFAAAYVSKYYKLLRLSLK